MSIDIDKLEALSRAATPGPWDTDEGGEVHSGGRTVYARPWLDGKAQKDADMAYGAAADPQTTLALIARLREAEQREQALAAQVERFQDIRDEFMSGRVPSHEACSAFLEAARDAPTASLNRLKAQWQDEVLLEFADWLKTEEGGNVADCLDVTRYMARRQAEGGE